MDDYNSYIIKDWRERAQKAEAENARLRAALFCKECEGVGVKWLPGHKFEVQPCPTCGPLRAELYKTQREGE